MCIIRRNQTSQLELFGQLDLDHAAASGSVIDDFFLALALPFKCSPTVPVFYLWCLCSCRVSRMSLHQSWKTSKKSSHLSQRSAPLDGSWTAQEPPSGMSACLQQALGRQMSDIVYWLTSLTGKPPDSYTGPYINYWYWEKYGILIYIMKIIIYMLSIQ